MDISDEDFDALVQRALSEIPEELLDSVDNLIFWVEDEPEDGSDTLGLFEGSSITERTWSDEHIDLPARIVLFKGPLSSISADLEELYDEILTTLIHELGHYNGITEDKLHELGWG